MGPSVQIMAIWIYQSIDDTEWLGKFIDELVRRLDMTVIMPTVFMRLPISNYKDKQGQTPDPNDEGISLVTMISESHIAMHTWPKHCKAFLEIASCKPYATKAVLDAIENYFPEAKVEFKTIDM
jgi:S-adenosylmethionine/arginine decarboxylase-like enzyme